MKKSFKWVLASLLVLGSASVVGTRAFRTTADPEIPDVSSKEILLYSEDFDNYSATNKDELWGETQFFWSDSFDMSISTNKSGKKGLLFTAPTDGCSCLGGFGSGQTGNLAKLVNGKRYHFQMYVEFNSENPGAEFIVEPHFVEWTGIAATKNDVAVRNPSTTWNAYWDGNVLNFDCTVWDGTLLENKYVSWWANNFRAGESLFVDDLKIYAIDRVWGMDYRYATVNNGGFYSLLPADGNDHCDENHLYGREWGVPYGGKLDSEGNSCISIHNNTGNRGTLRLQAVRVFNWMGVAGHKVRVTINYKMPVGSLVRIYPFYPDPYTPESTMEVWPGTEVSQDAILCYTSDNGHQLVTEVNVPSTFTGEPWGNFITWDLMFDNEACFDVYSMEIEIMDGPVNKAAAVIEKIEAIGEVTYTPECRKLIDDAFAAVQACTDPEALKLVDTRDLIFADTTYDSLKAAAEKEAALVAVRAAIDDVTTPAALAYKYTSGAEGYSDVDFRLSLGLGNLADLKEAIKGDTSATYAIEVEIESSEITGEAASRTFVNLHNDEANNVEYVLLDLGDCLANTSRLSDKFTYRVVVSAFGETITGKSRTVTAKELIVSYFEASETKRLVRPLIHTLQSLGVSFSD